MALDMMVSNQKDKRSLCDRNSPGHSATRSITMFRLSAQHAAFPAFYETTPWGLVFVRLTTVRVDAVNSGNIIEWANTATLQEIEYANAYLIIVCVSTI